MIGRKKEIKMLRNAAESKCSEFVAVYGRRRVGKTFLVRETFNSNFTFQHSGVANSGTKIQLERFRRSSRRTRRTSESSSRFVLGAWG